MNTAQKQHGDNKLKVYTDRWGLDKKTTATILLDLAHIKEFWGWVNASEYLYDVIYDEESE